MDIPVELAVSRMAFGTFESDGAFAIVYAEGDQSGQGGASFLFVNVT